MTQISYIHGIPADETASRSAAAAAAMQNGFIPYLSLTAGEMQLALLRQRLLLLSRYYSDVPEYAAGAQLVNDALNADLHKGINFVGAIPDELQPVARVIANAARFNQPAAAAGYWWVPGRQRRGIGDIIPAADRLKACQDSIAKKYGFPNIPKNRVSAFEAEIEQCRINFEIEKIFNERLQSVSYHTVYNRLLSGYSDLPTRVDVKRILHQNGIEGMANTATLDASLMSDWVENAVMLQSVQLNAGPQGSVPVSFALAPSPNQMLEQYNTWAKTRPGAISGIGVLPVAAVIAIITAIGAVAKQAYTFVLELRKQKALAMAQVQGFGTQSFSGDQNDWITGQNNPTNQQQNQKLLTYGALAAGAYLLLNED